MKRLLLLALISGVLVANVRESRAAFITFTDQAAWEAAVTSSILVEDFNSQTLRTFSNPINESGFIGFSLSGNTASDAVSISSGANLNGTQFLRWFGDSDGPTINFNLTQSSNAFAFNWLDTDPTDEYELLIDGQSFFNPPFSSGISTGFFGIVKTDGLFSVATIRNAVGQTPGGVINTFGVDNVRIAQVSAVPEPSSIALFGLGAIGMTIVAVRRRERESAA